MSNEAVAIEAAIRRLLQEAGKLAVDPRRIKDADDLYELGLSSLATVGLMISIEAEFDIEIPDALLTRDNFRSIGALTRMVQALATVPAV